MLPFRRELTWPADIYLEGSDQHRGWFQSSLLVGIGTRGRPPFNQVLTHGFIVAEDGRKMSKSLGNFIEPLDVIKQSGADIIRLWVSMSDYTQEIRLSKEILARAVEAYRKIRNTLRILAANLYDFDPAVDLVDAAHLEEVDRYILAKYADLAVKVGQGYTDYDYPTIFQLLNAFATVDLSAFYVDVTKDRVYTFAARSRERRAAQTAMYIIVDGLARLVAPILTFTADELWRHLPGARDESVHMAIFPAGPDLAAFVDAALVGAVDPADRDPRPRPRRHRAASQREENRQLAPGESGPVGVEGRPRVSGGARGGAADAVHRVGGGIAAGTVRRRSARRTDAARDHRARRRREVRALLALRA